MKSWLALIAIAAALAGCSGGGANSCGTSVTPIGGGASGASGSCGGTVVDTTPKAADLIVTVTTSQVAGILNTGKDTATVTVTAVDSNRNAIADVPVTIQPDDTAIVTPSGTTTDATGVVTGAISLGDNRSNRTIAVSVVSGAVSKVVNIPVTGATLTANVPAQVAPGASNVAQYHLVDGAGQPMVGVTINISGTFTSAGATDANGNYTYTFTAPTTGTQLEFDASAAGVSRTDTTVDSTTSIPPAVGTVIASSAAANPSTVAVNATGSQANEVDIRALFLADHNAPVQNVRVRFDLANDTNHIGGTLSSGTNVVYSDSDGVARTLYFPGTRSSGIDGVTVRACWDYNDFDVAVCPHSVTTALTVQGQSVSLTVGTDGKLSDASDSSTNYQQAFSVQVVDSVGNPMPGVTVKRNVIPNHYYLGEFAYSGGAWGNIIGTNGVIPTVACNSEDINGNNTLDVFGAAANQTEDQNGDLQLTPRGADFVLVPQVAATGSTPDSSVTNQFGRALFYFQYAKNYAYWVDYTMTFTTSVEGSEGLATYVGRTDATAEDVANPGTPPWFVSPYGTNVRRTVTNGVTTFSQMTVPLTLVTDAAHNVSTYLCNAPQ